MRLLTKLAPKRHLLYFFGLFLAGGLLLNNSVSVQPTNAQGVNSIYLTPASGAYTVGETIAVSVRENSGSTTVNAVTADLQYSSNLQYVSIDAAGSAFGLEAGGSNTGSVVSVARGTFTAVSGDQYIAKVNFKVLATGTATVTVQGSSQLVSSTTNADITNDRNGSSYTLNAPAPGVTPPAPAPAATPPKASTTANPSTTKAAAKPQVTIAPQGSAQVTAMPGGSLVELAAPATVETKPDSSKEVAKVEYILNGKVVETDTTPPYTHDFNKNLRNGTYKLTTKTYYKNGTNDVSISTLRVSNTFGLTQLRLQLWHYAWLIIIILIVIGELVYLLRAKARKSHIVTSSVGHVSNAVTPRPFDSPAQSPSLVTPKITQPQPSTDMPAGGSEKPPVVISPTPHTTPNDNDRPSSPPSTSS